MALVIKFSREASATLADLKQRASKAPNGPQGKIWNAIREVMTLWLPQPELAFDPSGLLRNEFKGIFRIRKGRWRVLYIASREREEVIMLYLGYRKAGDRHDVYAEFGRRLKRGDFDSLFARLDLKRRT